MGRINIILITLICIFFLSYCKKSTIFNHLYGTWVDDGNDGNISIFKRSSKLDQNKYGFIIYPDGEFVERNSGWCGTPPLTFFNESGKWRKISETLLEITINRDWRPTYKMEIQSNSENILKVIFIEAN